jgi:hypothetical protein
VVPDGAEGGDAGVGAHLDVEGCAWESESVSHFMLSYYLWGEGGLPALFTRASMRAYLLATWAKARCMDASSSMSSWIGTTSDLESGTSLFKVEIAAVALSRERLPIRIVWTCGEAYSAFTVSYPIPVFPPVIRTIDVSDISALVVGDV